MTDSTPAIRAAYAEIVAAVADARPDPATESFDAVLDSAVANGQLDEQLARTVRWWQRESVRGLRDHLADVLPTLFEALDTSALRANDTDTPDSTSRAENHRANPNAAPGRDSTRTVESTGDPQSPPMQRSQNRRRVLVASLVAANGSAIDARSESGEGRR